VELDPSSWGNSWQEKNSLALFRGPTSVSDNAFERAQRLMKIAILIHENSDEIRTQMTRSPELKKELRKQLCRVAQALENVGQMFREQSQMVAEFADRC
jgi:hypothetical protein